MTQYDLLTEPLISVVLRGADRRRCLSLPELYAALAQDNVVEFPGLRPHQRHVWHAFLTQVGALALREVARVGVPEEADRWRDLLRALTPGAQGASAWSLVAPADSPAVLQPPVPGADHTRAKGIATPGQLDMLVTSRNHELKRGLMHAARPEHWLYALVSLQTQEGFLGRGNYGVSRMNGGFSSRSGFGIAPAGGPGTRVIRDIRALLLMRKELLDRYPSYPATGGVALVWLLPWDGESSLSLAALDPFYVEICRRVRMEHAVDGALRAVAWSSSVARVKGGVARGVTGDPWTPVVHDADGPKALTFDRQTIGYQRLTPLLFPRLSEAGAAQRAPLQRVTPEDDADGLSLLVHGLVRGEGKTDGLYSRRIPISSTRRSFMSEQPTDPVADMAHDRVRAAGEFVRRVFYPAALCVFTAAPSRGERARDDDTAKSRVGVWCRRLDDDIDQTFFSDLEHEAVAPGPDDAGLARQGWLLGLREMGRSVLGDLVRQAPDAAMRHYRVRVRASDTFDRAFRRFLEREGASAPALAATPTLDASTGLAGDGHG